MEDLTAVRLQQKSESSTHGLPQWLQSAGHFCGKDINTMLKVYLTGSPLKLWTIQH